MTDPAPHTPEEIRRWALERPPHEREAVPEPGERLLFRRADFGETVPAVVDAVQDMTTPGDHWGPPRGTGEPDPNVWDAGGRVKDDPWPWVSICPVTTAGDGTETLGQPRWVKESRVRGSAGWLREGSRSHTGDYSESGN